MENKLVGWSEEYSLHMPELDAQHKTLFDLINRLWANIINNAPHSEQIKLLEKLEYYTQTHFTAEESFLGVIGFPNLDEHKHAHATFTKRIAKEKQNILAGMPVSLDLLHFLNGWLVHHIQGEDQAYAKYAERSKERSMLGRFFKIFS